MTPKVLIVSLFAILLIAAAFNLHAKQIAQLNHEGVTVILTDEPCQLDVKLPYRLTWTEKGKTFEGCFTIQSGIVVAFFDDRSIGLLPGQAFRPVTEL